MTSVAITGGTGFLGWHVACRLRARHGIVPVLLGRADVAGAEGSAALRGADVVLHLAGVNRAGTEAEVEDGNVEAASRVAAAIAARDEPARVVYANSIHAGRDTGYGRGKQKAADLLGTATRAAGGRFVDVRLPNVFGEHGRAHYNSFVATFAGEVAAGREPSVSAEAELPLLHAQDAAAALIDAGLVGQAGSPAADVVEPPGRPTRVGEVADRLLAMDALYRRGELPDLSEPFDRDLFNVYRAARFPAGFPAEIRPHTDDRGRLVEMVRSHGGTGQSFISTTRPGQTRGNHYHLRKVERFVVVAGEAEIRLRRLGHQRLVRFRLSGERPAYVDMPTLWTHSITNVGESELVTAFWSDQLLDPEDPDQYPGAVLEEDA